MTRRKPSQITTGRLQSLRLFSTLLAISLIDHCERLGRREKLGSNLGQLDAENRVKPWSVTQSQAKRINEIAFLWFLRDQGVGGSNPLAPTNLYKGSSDIIAGTLFPCATSLLPHVKIPRVQTWDALQRELLPRGYHAAIYAAIHCRDHGIFRIGIASRTTRYAGPACNQPCRPSFLAHGLTSRALPVIEQSHSLKAPIGASYFKPRMTARRLEPRTLSAKLVGASSRSMTRIVW